jgi:hypothetical protein
MLRMLREVGDSAAQQAQHVACSSPQLVLSKLRCSGGSVA